MVAMGATVTLDQKIDNASALIRGVFADNEGAACVTCSFQTECMALVDLVIAQHPNIPVLFLETGYHFPETYAYRDQMTEQLHLNLVNLSAKISVPSRNRNSAFSTRPRPTAAVAFAKWSRYSVA